MVLQNDCPYEAKDDGRFAINDVRNVYVDEFDLGRTETLLEETSTEAEALCRASYRFLLEKGEGLLHVASVLKHSSAPLPTLPDTTRGWVSWANAAVAGNQVSGREETRLTNLWPLITSSRSSSLEPSRKSLNRSTILHGGLRCHKKHTL